MLKIHKFDTTEEAYDATQCSDDINTGDILIIECERVVGIADTWPIAVTREHGALHVPVGPVGYTNDKTGEQYAHLDLAFDIAKAYGWNYIDLR